MPKNLNHEKKVTCRLFYWCWQALYELKTVEKILNDTIQLSNNASISIEMKMKRNLISSNFIVLLCITN